MRPGQLLEKARDLTAELVMVVLGILIAFALNSWWEGREAAQRRRAHLEALERDFQENVTRLDALTTFEAGVADASARLLALAGRPAPLPADTALALVGRVFSSQHFEAVMGAYEGVVASGGVAQLTDAELASRLARFAAALRTSYAIEYSDRLYFDLIHDASGRLGFLFRAFPPGHAPRRGADSLPTQAELAALLGDARIREELGFRAFAERDAGRTYRDLRLQAAGVLTRVRADLAED